MKGREHLIDNVIDLQARIEATRVSTLGIFGPTMIEGLSALQVSVTRLATALHEAAAGGEIAPIFLASMTLHFDQLRQGVEAVCAASEKMLPSGRALPGLENPGHTNPAPGMAESASINLLERSKTCPR